MTPKLFSELGLSPEVLKAIEKLGFEQASPIQADAIPVLREGRDVVGQSQTGSGKTAAFGIPAIEKIDPKLRAVQVLVLCPTRELAVQVCEEIHKLALFKRGVKALPIFGGQSYDRQFAGLRAGANIVVGTPGRVMDHMDRGTLSLAEVRTVILDEADEMLDMGFREDIEKILEHAPAERQTVLFSATIPRPIEELIARYTRNPARVQIAAKALTVPTVEQVYYEVHRDWRFEALIRLIDLHEVNLGIIFCNTQRTVDELTEHLHTAGYDADALHGGLAQAARDRVMKKFKTGVLTLLVATDVAGRGIDVNNVEVVFNFDLPHDPEDYVHRIGRTGRAGREGMAITLVSGRDVFRIRYLERFTGKRMKRGTIPSEGELVQARERALLDDVRTVIQHGDLAPREALVARLLEEGFDSVAVASALLHLLAGGQVPEAPEEEPDEPKGPRWEQPETSSVRPSPAAAEAVPKPERKPREPKAAPKEKWVPITELVPRPSAAPAETTQPSLANAAEPQPAAAPVPATVAAESSPSVDEPSAAPRTEPEALTPAPAGNDLAATETASPAQVTAPAAPTPAFSVEEEIGYPESEPLAAAPDREAPQESPAAPPEAPFITTPPKPPARARDRGHKVEVRMPEKPRPPAEPPRLRAAAWDRPGFASRPPQPAAPSSRNWDRPERPFDRARPATGFREERGVPPWRSSPGAEPRPRSNRHTVRPDNALTRLWLGVGELDGVTPRDVVGCILGESGLGREAVGRVQLLDQHCFVEVAAEHTERILASLNQAVLRGRRVRARVADRH